MFYGSDKLKFKKMHVFYSCVSATAPDTSFIVKIPNPTPSVLCQNLCYCTIIIGSKIRLGGKRPTVRRHLRLTYVILPISIFANQYSI